MARKKTIPHPELKSVNDNAAAIDIGSTMHMAAVNPECVFRGDPATCTDSIRLGIPGHPATPKSPLFKRLRGDL